LSKQEENQIIWYKALASTDLKPGSLCKVHLLDREILLVRLKDGTLTSSSSVCPHESADLTKGMLYMDAIDCPLHHYLYDLRTGENRYPRNVFPEDLAAKIKPLPLYSVQEKNGWIWVSNLK